MGGTGRTNEPPKQGDNKPKPPRKPVDDDDYEDGDFTTPKHDHTGNDDEPL